MTTLHADDFNREILDMWNALVEDAILRGRLPKGTKADDVETITVEVVEVSST